MFTIIGFLIWMYLVNSPGTVDDNVFFISMVVGIVCIIIGIILDSVASSVLLYLTKIFTLFVCLAFLLLFFYLIKSKKNYKNTKMMNNEKTI